MHLTYMSNKDKALRQEVYFPYQMTKQEKSTNPSKIWWQINLEVNNT